ncbi:hypothetical protein [Ralstonia mojiangensis]
MRQSGARPTIGSLLACPFCHVPTSTHIAISCCA